MNFRTIFHTHSQPLMQVHNGALGNSRAVCERAREWRQEAVSATEAARRRRREIRRKEGRKEGRKRRRAPKGEKERSDDGRKKERKKERANERTIEELLENQIVMAAETKSICSSNNSFQNGMQLQGLSVCLSGLS